MSHELRIVLSLISIAACAGCGAAEQAPPSSMPEEMSSSPPAGEMMPPEIMPPEMMPPEMMPEPPALVVEIGTGANAFEPLAEDSSVPLIFGPQGGYHIWAGARIEEATAGTMTLKFELALESGEIISSTGYRVRFEAGGQSWAGHPAFVEDPNDVLGRRVRMRLIAVDAAGRTGTDERLVSVMTTEEADRIGTMPSDSMTPEVAPETVSFARDVVPILENDTYMCNACHHSDEHFHYGLSMLSFGSEQSGVFCNNLGTQWYPCADPQMAYRNLVGVPSREVDMSLVTPGDPEQSYLVHKLRGTHVTLTPRAGERVGERMPRHIGMYELMRPNYYGPLDGVVDIMHEMGGMMNQEGVGTNDPISDVHLEIVTTWILEGAKFN
jgi:hypothetical protein